MQTQQDMENVIKPQRRSVKLSKEEYRDFKKAVKAFDTKIEAAEFFGFSLVTLDNVLLKGSGKPKTIEIIIEKLYPKEAA